MAAMPPINHWAECLLLQGGSNKDSKHHVRNQDMVA
jgi:hypothetical protein